MHDLIVTNESVGEWRMVAVRHQSPSLTLAVPVLGVIGNSIPTSETGKRRLVDWKKHIATCTKRLRGLSAWNPAHRYAISLGFSFHRLTGAGPWILKILSNQAWMHSLPDCSAR